MRYTLTLTNAAGDVLEFWYVTLDDAAAGDRVTSLKGYAARAAFIDEVVDEIAKAEQGGRA